MRGKNDLSLKTTETLDIDAVQLLATTIVVVGRVSTYIGTV